MVLMVDCGLEYLSVFVCGLGFFCYDGGVFLK